jgi:hypothetical protein
MSDASRSLQEKQSRQKKILAVSSVILLALVGFQLPRLMGGGGGGGGAPATPGAAPAPDAQLAVTPTGSLPDTDRVSIQAGSGQLVSFGLFKSKDPFIQQLVVGNVDLTSSPEPAPVVVGAGSTQGSTTTPAPTSTPPSTANGSPTPTTPSLVPVTVPFPATTPITTLPSLTPVVPAPVSTSPVAPTPLAPTPNATTPVAPTPVAPTPVAPTPNATTPKTTTTPVVAPTSVSIATNGVCEIVNVDGTFPGNEDIFRVISIAKDGKSAKISVVGGAYDSGASAVTLKMGEKLTLVNTADGTRYVLQLKSQCDVQTQPVSGSGSVSVPTATVPTATAPTATVAPPTITSSVTTPIVTDALDPTFPTG